MTRPTSEVARELVPGAEQWLLDRITAALESARREGRVEGLEMAGLLVERPVEGERFWSCKIGPAPAEVPPGGDWPLRKAVREAFVAMFGAEARACFSGWGAHLTEPQRAVMEGREPDDKAGEVRRG